jgi:hypothetical protein
LLLLRHGGEHIAGALSVNSSSGPCDNYEADTRDNHFAHELFRRHE